MTEYFEVVGRDGAARLGELRLADPVTTPGLADDVVVDGGSEWVGDREEPTGADDALTILPHRGLPGGTPDEVTEAFAPTAAAGDADYPSAVVISPTTATDYGADAYVLSGARRLDGHGEALREALVATRREIPPDTALYLPGTATPAVVPLLAYAGVDLVDTDRAVLEGTRGHYLTTEGRTPVVDLDELPCACPACDTPVEDFTSEDCVAHNVNALEATLRTVRQRIRDGRLRDYLDGQVRHVPWLTAGYREFDAEWGYLEERTPVVRRSEITATTDDTLRRVEIRRFADRVTSRYRCRFDAPLVLLPCSARKPYSDSQSHKQFYDAIRHRGHVVSMTSPIGVVPTELELTYPAQHYDTAVTGRWSASEVEFVSAVLDRYLDRTDYPSVVAHVPDEGYREVVERATADRDLDVTYTVADHPTTSRSLRQLSEALEGEPTYSEAERLEHTIRSIADFQFGDGAGDALFSTPSLVGRYPKLRVDEDGQQVATLVPQYGTLAFTIAGARQWADSDAPTLTVAIDDFVPHGNVLAPGVLEASPAIRPGDEVVVSGPGAFAVGRAEMSGPEMAASTRGIAVSVRHVEER